MPAATTHSLPTIRRFAERCRAIVSALQERHPDDEAEEEHDRDRRQDQSQAAVRFLLLFGGHGPGWRAAWCQCGTAPGAALGFTREGSASSTRVALTSRRGGTSKVWNGAGDGTSHS